MRTVIAIAATLAVARAAMGGDFRPLMATYLGGSEKVEEWTAVEVAPDGHVVVAGSAPDLIRDVRLFDIYTGEGIEAGRKSVAIGLILQETSRTLTDEDADTAMAAAIAKLENKFAADLRD